jgi:hypothetical protein
VHVSSDQVVVFADMNLDSDLIGRDVHIPEGYRKDMHFGGREGDLFSVTLP